ncbi:PREDICTED: uncharacterized protein LOC105449786 [Wasmannia auropunctata]|uniref:uncharacterized protein LOC105449786 n=1 Tax=Wasmannia auropunctata TaxID=64793 RepID=UPI0005EE5959|nr:PREDICTED: uncharacterized protein LOC105449786 [Wasmannia auropunctata]
MMEIEWHSSSSLSNTFNSYNTSISDNSTLGNREIDDYRNEFAFYENIRYNNNKPYENMYYNEENYEIQQRHHDRNTQKEYRKLLYNGAQISPEESDILIMSFIIRLIMKDGENNEETAALRAEVESLRRQLADITRPSGLPQQPGLPRPSASQPPGPSASQPPGPSASQLPGPPISQPPGPPLSQIERPKRWQKSRSHGRQSRGRGSGRGGGRGGSRGGSRGGGDIAGHGRSLATVMKMLLVLRIEERIKALQERKLEITRNELSGDKRNASTKLALNDLKSLFGF